MVAIIKLLIWSLLDGFKSRGSLEAEVTILRHQLNILHRHMPKRIRPSGLDRAVFAWLYQLFPDIGRAVRIVRPETLVRWHRMGFRAWWRWKSQNRGGRPKIDQEIRDLIRRMCKENPLWGAPRIHGELLKLGFDVAQSTVSKYMERRQGLPSQGWKTFLRNHADGIAAVDFLVIPTLTFEKLFAFIVLRLGRRRLLWIGVTAHPTAEWLARQITEAFSWDTAPAFLIRDNDGAYGELFTRRVRSTGIRDRPAAPRSPWQNGYVERVIGSIRRECLEHMVVLCEAHLRRVLSVYAEYYNTTRTHLGIAKDSPNHRLIQHHGTIIAKPILGGLHHRYARI
jgi:transposase InsO family protein